MITDALKPAFLNAIDFDPIERIKIKKTEVLPVDYFHFYNAISSVYSSKIEGENIDFDSFYKYKFLHVPYNPDYTKKQEDLFLAHEFVQTHSLNRESILTVHEMMSMHLLSENQQGKIRSNQMFVINEQDRIEYVACEPGKVGGDLNLLFDRIGELLAADLPPLEVFFYAAQIHLVFVKIHPFQDGNGRMARLLEKWFLLEKLGQDAVSVESEKNYYVHRSDYYHNLRRLGLEYQNLDYTKALPFLLMTINSLK